MQLRVPMSAVRFELALARFSDAIRPQSIHEQVRQRPTSSAFARAETERPSGEVDVRSGSYVAASARAARPVALLAAPVLLFHFRYPQRWGGLGSSSSLWSSKGPSPRLCHFAARARLAPAPRGAHTGEALFPGVIARYIKISFLALSAKWSSVGTFIVESAPCPLPSLSHACLCQFAR